MQMFADDKSLFSVVHDIDTSENNLNHDLEKIREWAFSGKRSLTQISPNRRKK